MKILMIGPAKSESQNYGLGLATENIAKQLSKKADLTIVSPSAASEIDDNDEEHVTVSIEETLLDPKSVDATAVQIKISSSLLPYFYHSPVESHNEEVVDGSKEIQDALQIYNQTVLKEVVKVKYDIIYAHDWLSIGSALELKKKYNKPFILHIHSLDYDRVGKKTNSWIYSLEKEGMEKADKVIAVSEYHSKIMQTIYGINRKKIEVIHLGIDPIESIVYQSPFKEDIILYAGRLSQQKGVFDFIEMASKLIEENENLRFIMAGDGELSQEVVSKVNEKGLESYFNFTGLIDRAALQGLMRECKVLVVPSISEPFGLVAMEAALNELPIVISSNSGATEILKGSFIPKVESVSGYVEQINLVLSNVKMVTMAIAENKEAATQRSWAAVGNEIFEILAST